MARITKEEVLKIAKLSHIQIHDAEIASLSAHLDAVLSYAARVQEIATEVDVPLSKNVNVFREDVIEKSDADLVLSRAPESEAHYFVVPAIIETVR